jgi:hypothetical protein
VVERTCQCAFRGKHVFGCLAIGFGRILGRSWREVKARVIGGIYNFDDQRQPGASGDEERAKAR